MLLVQWEDLQRSRRSIVAQILIAHLMTKWEHGHADHDRWNDFMAKLRAFKMAQCSRVLMLDSD